MALPSNYWAGDQRSWQKREWRMLVSVVIRTKDEVHRLRLILASLSRQTVPVVARGVQPAAGESAIELIVVNDGSRDGTRTLLEETAQSLPLLAVHHSHALGR